MLDCHYDEGEFRTFDGVELFYRFFKKRHDGNILVLLHGHGEHSGRYTELYQRLQSLVSIATFDFRGHGRSQGEEVYVESFDDYLKDVSCFHKMIQDRYSCNGKIILLGHSLGGLVAVHWAMQNPDAIKALILSSPCLGLKIPQYLIAINQIISEYFPHFVYKNPIYPPYLTHDEKEIIEYKKDRMIKRKITAKLVREILVANKTLFLYSEWNLKYPVLILKAGSERIVDNLKIERFYEKVRSEKKEMKVFEGFYHELFHEIKRAEVYKTLYAYIQKIQD